MTGLGQGIVVGVPDAAHRGLDPGLGQTLGVADGHVLGTPVAVMHQSVLTAHRALTEGLIEGVPLQCLEPLSLIALHPRPNTPTALRPTCHLRSVSAVQPSFDTTETIAAHCESCSVWCSSTKRTAFSVPPGNSSSTCS